MSHPPQVPALTRLGASAMRLMNRITQGYDPVFLSQLLHQLGPGELMRWGEEVTAIVEALEAELDPACAQHVIAFAALLNGCRVCSVGHMYAGNLELFDATGRLFPVDERDVFSLQQLEDDELLWELSASLKDGYVDTFERIAQLYELKTDVRSARTALDHLLLRAVAAWDILADSTVLCTVEDPANIDPLTPIAKNKSLRRRYAVARGRDPE